MLSLSLNSRLRRSRTFRLVSLGLLALAAACSDQGPFVPPNDPSVAVVQVTPATLTVLVDEMRQFTATLKAEDGRTLTGRGIAWSSSDTAVASVSTDGVMQSKRGGTATITATSEGKSGSAQITVNNPAPAIQALMPSSAHAGGEAFVLTVSGANFVRDARVLWNGTALVTTRVSATELRAQVSAEALAEQGSAEVAVENPLPGGGVSTSLGFLISAMPVASVTVSPPALELIVGTQQALEVTLKAANGTVLTGRSIEWTSSNTAFASVDATGKVTAHAEGTVIITATSEDRSGSVQVTVRPVPPAPVASITISPSVLALETGSAQHLVAVLKDANGHVLTGRVVQWTSNNVGVASVSGDGTVVAHAIGSVVVTAHSEGKTASVAVAVDAAPAADLLYNRISAGDVAELFTLSLGTQDSQPVRIHAGTTAYYPSASPDGNRIVYYVSRYDAAGKPMSEIFAVDRNGANLEQITTTDGYSDEPAWSPVPGMNRIVFRRYSWDTERSDIWIMDADGSNARNLTGHLPNGELRSSPAWSRDGQWIAFASSRAAGNIQGLWIIRTDGTGAQQLTSGMASFDMYPSWSPDGKHIAFSRFVGGDSDIAIVNVETGALVRLARPGHQADPAWSPDGRHLAFAEQVPNSGWQIFTMRPDGTDVRRRTTSSEWGGGRNVEWIRRQ